MTRNREFFRSPIAAGLLAAASLSLTPQAATAQQMIQLTTPYQRINDSFYEHFGIGWGIDRMGPNGGWFFNTGPAGSAIPPFGGYDPGANASFGFGGNGFGFNWTGGTGSDRSMVMESPTLTLTNGVPGSLFSGSVVPFVTGVVPVVGGAPMGFGPQAVVPQLIPDASAMNPLGGSILQERLARLQQERATGRAAAGAEPARRVEADGVAALPPAAGEDPPLVLKGDAGASPQRTAVGSAPPAARSTANHGDISVAEIRRQQADEKKQRDAEVQGLIEQARGCEEAGQSGVARIYYQQAAARAQGALQRELQEKVRSLD